MPSKIQYVNKPSDDVKILNNGWWCHFHCVSNVLVWNFFQFMIYFLQLTHLIDWQADINLVCLDLLIQYSMAKPFWLKSFPQIKHVLFFFKAIFLKLYDSLFYNIQYNNCFYWSRSYIAFKCVYLQLK